MPTFCNNFRQGYEPKGAKSLYADRLKELYNSSRQYFLPNTYSSNGSNATVLTVVTIAIIDSLRFRVIESNRRDNGAGSKLLWWMNLNALLTRQGIAAGVTFETHAGDKRFGLNCKTTLQIPLQKRKCCDYVFCKQKVVIDWYRKGLNFWIK